MSMHLMPSFVNSNGSGKRKPTAQQLKAKAEHDAWLKKMGVDSESLTKKNSSKGARKLKGNFVHDRNGLKTSDTIAPGGAKRSVFDTQWQDPYREDAVMAEREALALAKAEARKSQVAPAYSKGAYQLITPGEDPKTLGRKI